MISNSRTIRVAAAAAMLAFLASCTRPVDNAAPAKGAKDEDEPRSAFVAFQQALKAKDADRIWSLLATESQADAERKARSVRDGYTKANAKERAEQEKALELSGKELDSLKGGGFVKSKRFLGKYHEIPNSKIDKIDVKGDKAVVNYIEEDGDKEKLELVREAGKWKVVVPMP
jgi:hypothetical protein